MVVAVRKPEEVPSWAGSGSVVDKIAKVLEAQEKGETGLELPAGITLDDIRRWIPKAVKSLSKVNPKDLERMEGRTGLEYWASPQGFATLEANMGGGGGTESLSTAVTGGRGISIGEMVFREILTHGRETTTELVDNLGAIQPEMLTLVINALIMDKFLKEWTEKDGTKTWELVEIKERNRMLGYTETEEDKEPKQLVDVELEKKKKKEAEKKVSIMSIPVQETAVELNKNKKVVFGAPIH